MLCAVASNAPFGSAEVLKPSCEVALSGPFTGAISRLIRHNRRSCAVAAGAEGSFKVPIRRRTSRFAIQVVCRHARKPTIACREETRSTLKCR